ncbi:hypothetical protein ACF07D_07500 [Leucobacter sp. NPDC015123]|uniref:hypothetical protein n=1 Tax=Leucobacter sp. NPDC015123 TaxID=3364129 RepID=UPI0036F498FB
MKRANDIERERMPYVQIDTNLWAVMRYPKDRPVAMIVGLANRDNVPLFFVQAWHPEPSRRRVISQHDTLEEANASVLWDLEKVNAAGRTRVGPPNGSKPAQK